MMLILLYILYFTSFINGQQNTRPLYSSIYKMINSNSPCVRRLNGTHTFGCSSDYGGNVGIIYKAQNDNDIRWLETNKAGPFIVFMSENLFTLDNLISLNKLDSVNGILLLYDENHSSIHSFSNEDTCPNRYSGLSGAFETCNEKKPWNPWGSQIMLHKWKFPIFLTTDNVSINECYTKFNTHSMDSWLNQQCSLQIFSHMFADVNSGTCMRRSLRWLNLNPLGYCDPLENQNIYAPLYPLHLYTKTKPRSLIVIAVRLDATSMFYGKEPGSVAAATSIVTLLMTAKILFNVLTYREKAKYDNNVLFTFFNGEAYDYIGSGRTVFSMKNGEFPFRERSINKEDIRIFIELSQLSNNKTVFSHYIKNDKDVDSVVIDFITRFEKYAGKYKINVEEFSSDKLIPPASLQNFLMADNKLPGLVLGPYKEQFTNKFYHSIYDDYSNAGYIYYNNTSIIPDDSLQAFISNFSIALASTLYTMINDTDVPVLSGNYSLANDLLYTYLVNATSPLFANDNKNIASPYRNQPSYYVGASGISTSSMLTKYVLAYLTSVPKPDITSVDNCTGEGTKNPLYKYYWLSMKDDGFCVQSTVNTTVAVSPAFDIEDYDMTSNQYSTWTESRWRSTEIRMFVIASKRYEIFTLGLGMGTFIISSVIIYRVKMNLEHLGIQN